MENLDGIIIINKPKGCTSHDIVYKVKKMLNKKVGHTGTLDPNAMGVLPILIGKGTSLSQFLINHNKQYIATIKLGYRTETADAEGKIIEKQTVDESIFNNEIIENVLNKFVGKQEQKPPIYSAIKVNGKKLYEYARSGKEVEIPTRNIEIYSLKLQDYNKDAKTITVDVHCSKGTYIRSLCEDICQKLGTVGYLQDLNRTQVGDFKLEDAITIEELQKNLGNEEFIDQHFISIEKFFKDAPELSLEPQNVKLLINGVKLDGKKIPEGVVKIYNKSNEFLGIAINQNGELKRKIMK